MIEDIKLTVHNLPDYKGSKMDKVCNRTAHELAQFGLSVEYRVFAGLRSDLHVRDSSA